MPATNADADADTNADANSPKDRAGVKKIKALCQNIAAAPARAKNRNSEYSLEPLARRWEGGQKRGWVREAAGVAPVKVGDIL